MIEKIRINWERYTIWLLVMLILVASGFIGYFETPYTAPPEQLEAVRESPDVSLTIREDGARYVLTPASGESTAALVFYPGARVHPNAYVPVLAPLVSETNVSIFIPQPPLNLAVLTPAMAASSLTSNPTIDQWYLGGHSLGGAMACRFAAQNPERVSGLVLVGAYCDRDISNTELRVLVLLGSKDTVINRQAYHRNFWNLPSSNTTKVLISGMNHSQAATYRGQPGDSPGSLSYQQAHNRIRTALADYLRVPEPQSSGNTSPSEARG